VRTGNIFIEEMAKGVPHTSAHKKLEPAYQKIIGKKFCVNQMLLIFKFSTLTYPLQLFYTPKKGVEQ